MSLDLQQIINKMVEEGKLEQMIEENLSKGINKALENLFGSYGDVTKIIEEKVKSVMVPYLESYDYSDYITKLDHVLLEVMKHSASENKNLLSNFKEIMFAPKEKTIKMSDLYNQWKKYVAQNVETDGLEVEYEDGAYYEHVEASFDVEESEDRSWSSFKYATLVFECEHDETMNFEIKLSQWTDSTLEGWEINYKRVPDLSNLRYLNEFELLLLNLTQHNTRLILDCTSDSDDVRPEKEPEVTYE